MTSKFTNLILQPHLQGANELNCVQKMTPTIYVMSSAGHDIEGREPRN